MHYDRCKVEQKDTGASSRRENMQKKTRARSRREKMQKNHGKQMKNMRGGRQHRRRAHQGQRRKI
jgi:hypothetical protein